MEMILFIIFVMWALGVFDDPKTIAAKKRKKSVYPAQPKPEPRPESDHRQLAKDRLIRYLEQELSQSCQQYRVIAAENQGLGDDEYYDGPYESREEYRNYELMRRDLEQYYQHMSFNQGFELRQARELPVEKVLTSDLYKKYQQYLK
jgi:hypothetical protein